MVVQLRRLNSRHCRLPSSASWCAACAAGGNLRELSRPRSSLILLAELFCGDGTACIGAVSHCHSLSHILRRLTSPPHAAPQGLQPIRRIGAKRIQGENDYELVGSPLPVRCEVHIHRIYKLSLKQADECLYGVEHGDQATCCFCVQTDIFRAIGLSYVPPFRRYFHDFQ